ncbi:hypothetical protein, partial [Citrobacter sp. VF227]
CRLVAQLAPQGPVLIDHAALERYGRSCDSGQSAPDVEDREHDRSESRVAAQGKGREAVECRPRRCGYLRR